MKKYLRFLAGLLCAVIIFSLTGVVSGSTRTVVLAADTTNQDSVSGSEDNVWSYIVNDDETLTLTAYTGSLNPDVSVTIPSVSSRASFISVS